MSTTGRWDVEHARRRIGMLGVEAPDALRLARYAALSTRVDPALLRALRTTMLPFADAGIEADLWFSPLAESAGSHGFVMDDAVVNELRRDLAAEGDAATQPALDQAWQITEQAHGNWPESMRIEERVTWMALKLPQPGEPSPLDAIERLLQPLVKAMADATDRGMEIARWAQRALRRFPALVHETDAALLLALGAEDRMGMSIGFPAVDRPRELPQSAAWILPEKTFRRRRTINVARYVEGLKITDASPSSHGLAVPDTNPPYLQVTWRTGPVTATRSFAATSGRVVPIPPSATDITLRTLAGDVFALDSVALNIPSPRGVDHATADRDDVDFARVCVQTRFEGNGSDDEVATGFFVSPDTVLSLWTRVDRHRVGRSCRVVFGGHHLEGTVVAVAPNAEVLIRLPTKVPDALVLPHSFAVAPGSSWTSSFLDGSTAVLLHGDVAATDLEVTTFTGATGFREKGMLALRVAQPGVRAPGLAGAPVVVDGRVIGYVVLGEHQASQGISHEFDYYARPMALIQQFIADATTRTEQPTVFVSYGAVDPYGKGMEMDDPQVDRVLAAIRAAGFDPVLDGGSGQPSADRLISTINSTAAGAFMLTPVSHGDSSFAHLSANALGYRAWASPGFGLACFRFRRQQLPPDVERLVRATGLSVVDLDGASDQALAEYATRQLSATPRTQVPDEAIAAVLDDLRHAWDAYVGSAARQTRHPDYPNWEVFVSSIREEGLFATPSTWEAWTQHTMSHSGAGRARHIVDTLAMFSFGDRVVEPLQRAAAVGDSSHAFSLNVMPASIGRSLVRRAWLGRPDPRVIVFRDQDWSTLEPGRVCDRVSHELEQAFGCSPDDARWLLQRMTAPIVLLFLTRPLPRPGYVAELKRLLPSAFILFMKGSNPLSTDPAIVELPPLQPGADFAFINAYKGLMRIVAPRPNEIAATDKSAPEAPVVKQATSGGAAASGRPRSQTRLRSRKTSGRKAPAARKISKEAASEHGQRLRARRISAQKQRRKK